MCVLLLLTVRDVAIVRIDRETPAVEPGDRVAFGGGGRNDPEQFLVFPSLAVGEQTPKIGDPRNFPEAPSTCQSPKQNQ